MDRLATTEPSPFDGLSTEELIAAAIDCYSAWAEGCEDVRDMLASGDVEKARLFCQEVRIAYGMATDVMSRIDGAHQDWVRVRLALDYPDTFGKQRS